MAANSISEKTPIKVQLGVLIFILSLIITAAVGYAKVQGHVSDHNVHHTISDLDERYPTQKAVDQRFVDLQRTADRIEAKLDRILEKRP